MKKIIDKNTVIVSGIASIFLVIGIIATLIYSGSKAGIPLADVIIIIFLEINIGLGFFIANSILTAVICFSLKSDKLYKSLFTPTIVLSVAMLIVNIFIAINNFIAFFTSLFWIFTIVHVYQTKMDSQKEDTII
jgi:hypothetical protein